MRTLLSLLPLVTGLALHAADPAGFKSLFNGQDLSGWKGDPTLWSVQAGVIVGQTTAANPLKSNTFLIWQGGDVKNFELRVMFRLTPDNEKNFANSGIQYRSRILDAASFAVGGYQGDMDADGKYVGMLYEEKGRGIIALPGQQVRLSPGEPKASIEVTGATAPKDVIASAYQPHEWNEYVIIAEGNHLRHFINGKPTAEVTELDEVKGAKSGVIALQVHTGLPMKVEFKDIFLKTLP